MAAIREREAHKFAEIFPFRAGDSLTALADSIAKTGQLEPIVLFEGKILEGRRRQAACIMRGIEPKFRQFGDRDTDGTDALEFSYAVNYHRRDDMTQAEKAIAAQKYATFKFGDNQFSGRHKGGSENSRPAQTQAEAAEKFHTSVDKIKWAKKVMEKGSPALQEAMRLGEVSISDAAAIADEPPEIQEKALDAKREGKARTAKGAVAAAHGPAVEDAGRVARELEAIIGKVERIDTAKVAARTRAAGLIGKAVGVVRKL